MTTYYDNQAPQPSVLSIVLFLLALALGLIAVAQIANAQEIPNNVIPIDSLTYMYTAQDTLGNTETTFVFGDPNTFTRDDSTIVWTNAANRATAFVTTLRGGLYGTPGAIYPYHAYLEQYWQDFKYLDDPDLRNQSLINPILSYDIIVRNRAQFDSTIVFPF